MSASTTLRSNVRWAILALLFFSTVLSDVGRQVLPIPVVPIHARAGKDVFTVPSINSRMEAHPAVARAANVRRHPLDRLGTAEGVADFILFPPSDTALWITGAGGGAGITRR